MNGFLKVLNLLSKLLITLLCLITYAFALYISASVVLGNLYYVYPQGISWEMITRWIVAAILLFALMILLMIYYWKGFSRGFWREFSSTALIIVYVVAIAFAGWLYSVIFVVFGPQGHSYTEDIDSYGQYDFSYSPEHFPEAITKDMEVIKYSYFYKYADAHQTDIYLEVKFDSEEKFNLYLDEAIESFGENGVYTYENPYDSSFTDVIEKDWLLWTSSNDMGYAAFIEMITSDSSDYSYVDMTYRSVSYSTEELIIIYNLTDIGSDIEISYYYPAYLKRFGVEFDAKNDFVYEYTEETE